MLFLLLVGWCWGLNVRPHRYCPHPAAELCLWPLEMPLWKWRLPFVEWINQRGLTRKAKCTLNQTLWHGLGLYCLRLCQRIYSPGGISWIWQVLPVCWMTHSSGSVEVEWECSCTVYSAWILPGNLKTLLWKAHSLSLHTPGIRRRKPRRPQRETTALKEEGPPLFPFISLQTVNLSSILGCPSVPKCPAHTHFDWSRLNINPKTSQGGTQSWVSPWWTFVVHAAVKLRKERISEIHI